MDELSAIISTIRHGEKDKNGELTELGHKQSAERGSRTEYLQGDVILLHSGVHRVQETLKGFADHIGMKNEEKFQSNVKKRINYQDYTSQYLQYLYDSKNKGELFEHWDDVNGLVGLENKRINDFLNQKDKSSEPEIYPSPKHMAVRMARVLATQIDFATITIPEVRTNFINGTHEPIIMSFLYYFLQDFNPKDLNFVESIGGTVGFSEGFDIYIHKILHGKNLVSFKFRDTEKEMDQVKLKEFCLSEEIV